MKKFSGLVCVSTIVLAALCASLARAQDASVHDSTTTEQQLYDALHRPPPPAPLPPGVRMRGAHRIGDTMAPANPAVALSINFAFASAEILPDSRDLLSRLAKAMSEGDLRNDRFQIVGHTDARGAPARNMKLSIARAQAVRDYLAQSGGIAPERLSVVGKGQSEPLNLSDPYAAENRRVEIVNTGPS